VDGAASDRFRPRLPVCHVGVFHFRAPALPAQRILGGGVGRGAKPPSEDRWHPRLHAQRTGSTPRVQHSGAALQLDPSHRSSQGFSNGLLARISRERAATLTPALSLGEGEGGLWFSSPPPRGIGPGVVESTVWLSRS